LTKNNLIKNLELVKHPEGGYYKEIYRSNETISKKNLPTRYNSDHSYATIIYYLLTGKEVSKFHKLKSDESWHFHFGAPLIIHTLNENGKYNSFELGITNNSMQAVVIIEKNTWFAAEVKNKESFSLVSCSVFPGFEFEDFQLASAKELKNLLTDKKELLNRFI